MCLIKQIHIFGFCCLYWVEMECVVLNTRCRVVNIIFSLNVVLPQNKTEANVN